MTPCKGFQFNLRDGWLDVRGKSVRLTRSESLLFSVFIETPGVVSSGYLLAILESQDRKKHVRGTVTARIHTLRQKLVKLWGDDVAIHTINSHGYRLHLKEIQ